MALRFADHVLLKAAAIQGDNPPSMIPTYPEADLCTVFVGTPYEASAVDRGSLLAALTELKDRGWVKLLEVMGPWHWQVTGAGLDRAEQLLKEQDQELSRAAATLRTRILREYEVQSHRGRAGGMPPPVDVAAICAEMRVTENEYMIQALRLRDQHLIDLKGLNVGSLAKGLGFLTEHGRQQLDTPPPGAAPTRTIAQAHQEIARLRRELEVAGTKPEGLIRDVQLKDRVAGLLSGERNFDTAVREATVILEVRVRDKSGLKDLSGRDLMSAAFKKHTGALILSDDDSEQEGVQLTFMGIVGWVRNSFHHRVIDATAQGDAMRIIAFIDWLLEEVDRARLR